MTKQQDESLAILMKYAKRQYEAIDINCQHALKNISTEMRAQAEQAEEDADGDLETLEEMMENA